MDIRELNKDSLISHFERQGYSEFEAEHMAENILSTKKLRE